MLGGGLLPVDVCTFLSDPFSPEYMSPGIHAGMLGWVLARECLSVCAALTVLSVYLACADGENAVILLTCDNVLGAG